MIVEAKRMLNEEETLYKVVNGLKILRDKIAPTMGAKGRHILIESTANTPIIINDGVNIAKQMRVNDRTENLGMRIGIDAAEETARRVGDSTSLTVITLADLSVSGKDVIKKHKANPVSLIAGMNYAMKRAAAMVSESSKPVENLDQIRDVAKISSRDDDIARLIVEALEFAGDDGIIKKDRTLLRKDHVKSRKGMHFTTGFVTYQLCREMESRVSVFEKPFVLLVKDDIYKQEQMAAILNIIIGVSDKENADLDDSLKKPIPFIIVVNQVSGEAVAVAVKALNKNKNFRNKVDIQIVLTPGNNSDDLQETLEDIRAVSGGSLVDVNSLVEEEVAADTFGRLFSAEITETSTILEGEENELVQKRINSRVNYLKGLIDTNKVEESPRLKHALKERISRLTSGIATIFLYAQTDNVWLDRQELLEDALMSTITAKSGGIVAGGGICLKNVKIALESEFEVEEVVHTIDFNYGRQIVLDCLNAGFEQILKNAGYDNNQIEEFHKLEDGIGVDVSTGETGNMLELGVIDPANSIITAILNAVANSGLILRLAGAIIYDEEEDQYKNLADAVFAGLTYRD